MKKSLIAALFSLSFSVVAHAQMPCPPPTPDWNRLATRLGLESSQFDAFSTVMEAEHEKRQALHKQTFDDMKVGMDAIDQETLEKLASILTEDQLAALEALQTDMRRHRPGPPPLNSDDRPVGGKGRMARNNGRCQAPSADESASQSDAASSAE